MKYCRSLLFSFFNIDYGLGLPGNDGNGLHNIWAGEKAVGEILLSDENDLDEKPTSLLEKIEEISNGGLD